MTSGPTTVSGRVTLLHPALAALATVSASLALAGVFEGFGWLPYVVATAAAVSIIGVAARMLRAPRPLVIVVQLLGVCCLAVALFSPRGALGFLPGPDALGDLGSLLGNAVDTIRSGVAPVPADAGLSCLLVLSIGAVAVIVDVCVVVLAAPAIAGLPLLCLYAVPASLDEEILPWWTFLLGGAAFALLLAAEAARKRRSWRGGAAQASPRARTGRRAATGTATPVAGLALGGVAVLLALLTGSQATLVGTQGRLPGSDSGGGKVATGQLGIKPFTRLRGMLDRTQHETTLFKVRGAGTSAPYLRALTLDRYVRDQGWVLRQPLPAGVRTFGFLPPEPGTHRASQTTNITVVPVHWNDVWLPVYGTPHQIVGTSSRWHYDSGTGIVYSTLPTHPDKYVEHAELSQPTRQQLRAASTDYSAIDQQYLQKPRVSRDIVRLARKITAGYGTPFGKAAALSRYFTDPANGFTYSTKTAPTTTGRALHTFLFDGKRGFCEQYASAMAVMLRELDIPSRVAIGFTGGTAQDGYRTITSLDAHAWVEVYFPGYGWLPFDPTPLTDGRKTVPSYLVTGGSGTGAYDGALKPDGDYGTPDSQAAPEPDSATQTGPQQQGSTSTPPPRAATGWLGVVLWILLGLTLVAVAVTLWVRRKWGRLPGNGHAWTITVCAVAAATVVIATAWLAWWVPVVLAAIGALTVPLLVRTARRRRHLFLAGGAGQRAAQAAWDEVLAEYADRGGAAAEHETPRAAVARMVRHHHLDEDGRRLLGKLVDAVERAWYGESAADDTDLAEVLRGVHASFARNAPLPRTARLFPRSVLRGSQA